jgi:hypothetical protein
MLQNIIDSAKTKNAILKHKEKQREGGIKLKMV